MSTFGDTFGKTWVPLGSKLNPLPTDVLMYNSEPLMYGTEYLTY